MPSIFDKSMKFLLLGVGALNSVLENFSVSNEDDDTFTSKNAGSLVVCVHSNDLNPSSGVTLHFNEETGKIESSDIKSAEEFVKQYDPEDLSHQDIKKASLFSRVATDFREALKANPQILSNLTPKQYDSLNSEIEKLEKAGSNSKRYDQFAQRYFI